MKSRKPVKQKAPTTSTAPVEPLDPFVPELYDPESREGLKHSLSWWLIGTGRLWRNLLDEKLKAAGQTQPRWRVLAWAKMLPGIRQTALAERMDLANPTMVRIIDSLEEQGMIERRESAGDRRVRGIHLTDKAGPLIVKIEAEVRQVGDVLLQDVSVEELRICLDVLRRVRKRVAELAEQGLGPVKGFPPPPQD
jgi:MarR family transcriptional regulator for hemolysin